MGIRADRESVGAVVTLAPPAVEDAEIQATLATSLHAARTGGLQRTAWVVQPDVATRNHLAGHVNIVIFYEHQMALHVAVFAQMDDVLDVPLAIIIPGMRLAGKDELDRAILVAGEFHHILKLLKNKRRAFVGRESARKPNGQGIRIQK